MLFDAKKKEKKILKELELEEKDKKEDTERD